MKTKILIIIFLLIISNYTNSQVIVSFNSRIDIENGVFQKAYPKNNSIIVSQYNVDNIKLKGECRASNSTPINVSIAISKLINWVEENDFIYGRYIVKANGALASSINFDKFYLPKNT